MIDHDAIVIFWKITDNSGIPRPQSIATSKYECEFNYGFINIFHKCHEWSSYSSSLALNKIDKHEGALIVGHEKRI